MFNKINNYIDPKDMEIYISRNGIYISNYNNIVCFNDNKIVLDKVSILGSKLVIKRLKKDELFICGNIDNISFNNE